MRSQYIVTFCKLKIKPHCDMFCSVFKVIMLINELWSSILKIQSNSVITNCLGPIKYLFVITGVRYNQGSL